MLGSVKWFNDQKGYGFITNSDGDKDYFFHHSDVKLEGYVALPDGQAVEFDPGETEKGLCATNVTLV